MDSIIPATVLSVTSLVNNLVSSVKGAKELAKQSSDPALKEQIAEVFDAILDIKERVMELDVENRSLREQLNSKAKVSYNPHTHTFYKENDPSPLCPHCFQGTDQLMVYLGSNIEGRRFCGVCKSAHYTIP